MKAFTFERLARATDAASAVAARPGAMFLAGGTTLVDLMKVDVLTPDTVVDVRHLGLSSIDVSDHAIAVGAAVTNSQLAWHPVVRDRFPVLSEAILSGATTQIRNMATVAGNILQRTRCPYFRDVHASCNRRLPGTGCDAITGFNRGHAVLGGGSGAKHGNERANSSHRGGRRRASTWGADRHHARQCASAGAGADHLAW
jgi:xanthine dehydrogenase YagS FAD-binding subunit